jgi:hypothetical protein
MGAQDYIEPNVGGSITGYRGTANAFVNTVTESAWTTVFVAYILYLLFLLIAPYFQARVTKEDIILESPTMEQVGRGASETGTPSASTIVTPGIHEESAAETQRGERFSSDMLDLGCAFRDAYLLLLGTTLVSFLVSRHAARNSRAAPFALVAHNVWLRVWERSNGAPVDHLWATHALVSHPACYFQHPRGNH